MIPELHEKEELDLVLPQAILRAELDSKVIDLGFRPMDELYRWKVAGRVKPWQCRNLLSFDVFYGSKLVTERPDEVEDGQEVLCDRLRVDYLLASHPVAHIALAVAKVGELLSCLGGVIKVSDQAVSTDDLQRLWMGHADSMSEMGWTPGSEELAIEIHTRYARRWRGYTD